MKAVKGYTKSDYHLANVVTEFTSIEEAAEYLANKTGYSKEHMIRCIMDDTACDFIYFPDGSVIVNEN